MNDMTSPDQASVRRRGRPPRQPGGQAETRTALIRTGIAMYTEHPFQGVGLEQVLRRVGVPKGSFYHYFSSKEAFGLAVIDAYGEYFASKLKAHFNNDRLSPLARLRNFVVDARQGMARFEFRRGCLIGNLGQEMGGTNDAFRERLEGVFLEWQVLLAELFNHAVKQGELAPSADSQRLSTLFWIGWEGAVLRAKLTQSPMPLDLFAEAFFSLLPHHAATQRS